MDPARARQLKDILDSILEASLALEKRAQETAQARSMESAAIGKLNELQKTFNKAFTDAMNESHVDSYWWRTYHDKPTRQEP